MKGDFVMHKTRRTLLLVGLVSLLLGIMPALAGAKAHTPTPPTGSSAGFYVPAPDKGAVKQIKDLVKQGYTSDAALLTAMVSEGHAVWFTGGTPGQVFGQVRKTMMLAKVQHTVPVLVAYNLPFRDCGQYSARNRGRAGCRRRAPEPCAAPSRASWSCGPARTPGPASRQ